MSAAQPTHYDVLGVSQNASPEEIKKRYRELARRYHPDVASAPDAASRFKEINEAHRVLADPARRSAYDAELAFARMRAEGRQKDAGTRGRGDTGTRPQRPNDPTTQRPTPNAQRPTPNPVETLIAEAQKAFSKMRYREAEMYARQALRLDRRRAVAYEILGDIHRARGRTDEAIAMYSYAIQLDRSSRNAQAKLDRLVGRPTGPTMAGRAARSARPGAQNPFRAAASRSLSPTRALVNGIGVALLAFLMVAFLGIVHEPPAPSAWFYDWNRFAIFSLLVSGGVCGFLMAVNGWLAPIRDELAPAGTNRARRSAVPLGAILAGCALLSFYAAFLIYMLIGFAQEAVSRSILRAFAAGFAVAAMFALLGQPNAVNLLLFGGNLAFLGFLAGWAAGDMFRG
jgi:curved DNA-binding protein CbpA